MLCFGKDGVGALKLKTLCLTALFLLGCLSATPTWIEQISTPVPEIPVQVVGLYAETALCLGKDPQRIQEVRWYRFQIHENTFDRNGYWVPPNNIFLSDRVWDNLDEDWARFVVRHESVHDLTGDLGHKGPHWQCQYPEFDQRPT